jgi:hypothetical protein
MTASRLLLLCALCWTSPFDAHATPKVSFAWSDVSFTAESGTHVEASVDTHKT